MKNSVGVFPVGIIGYTVASVCRFIFCPVLFGIQIFFQVLLCSFPEKNLLLHFIFFCVPFHVGDCFVLDNCFFINVVFSCCILLECSQRWPVVVPFSPFLFSSKTGLWILSLVIILCIFSVKIITTRFFEKRFNMKILQSVPYFLLRSKVKLFGLLLYSFILVH